MDALPGLALPFLIIGEGLPERRVALQCPILIFQAEAARVCDQSADILVESLLSRRAQDFAHGAERIAELVEIFESLRGNVVDLVVKIVDQLRPVRIRLTREIEGLVRR